MEALKDAGEQAQLLRYFEPIPSGWPMAALQRQADSGDACGFRWLRADPVHVRPDISGARLMAWGNLGAQLADSGDQVAGDLGGPQALQWKEGVDRSMHNRLWRLTQGW